MKGFKVYEIFALVVKMTSIRTVLSIAASMNMEIESLDVKTTFLHEELDEEIYMQKKGFDFYEIFALVVKMTSIRTVLSIVANMNLEIEQLDVKTTFLHGELDEEIYMQ